MPRKSKRFYDLIEELEKNFPEKIKLLEELKEIYDETKGVISRIVGGISKVVHMYYTPDLFSEEDLDNVRKVESTVLI